MICSPAVYCSTVLLFTLLEFCMSFMFENLEVYQKAVVLAGLRRRGLVEFEESPTTSLWPVKRIR